MNYSTIKTTVLTSVWVVMFVLVAGLQPLSAQTDNSGDRVMFIMIEDLSPDAFQKIGEALKNDNSIKINQACVPAEVIMFDIPASNTLSLDENFNNVRGKVMENTSLRKVSILAEYSEQDFMDRCKMFRMGGMDQ
jgi:hypothetical protein